MQMMLLVWRKRPKLEHNLHRAKNHLLEVLVVADNA